MTFGLGRGSVERDAQALLPLLGNRDLISPFLALPKLRAFWPMSSLDASNNPQDISGQARHMTNTGTATFGVHANIVPYTDLNGSTQYHTLADASFPDITGAMTAGGWFWWDSVAAASIAMSKNGTAGNRGWALHQNAPAQRVQISSDGTATTTQDGPSIVVSGWYFLWLRYLPSTYLDAGYGALYARNTTSIPAATFNNTAACVIGANNAGANPMDGRAALCFVCADALSDALMSLLFESTRPYFGV